MTINRISFARVLSDFSQQVNPSTLNGLYDKIARVVLAVLLCGGIVYGVYRLWQWAATKPQNASLTHDSKKVDQVKTESHIQVTPSKATLLSNEKVIPMTFKTEVLPKKSTGEHVQPLTLQASDTGLKRGKDSIYYLRNAANGELLGEMEWRLEGANTCVKSMKSYGDNTYTNLQEALFELAIRTSFSKAIGGRVQIDSHCASQRSLFNFGFRYLFAREFPHNHKFLTDQKTSQIISLAEQYFTLKKDNKPTDEKIEEIQKIFDDNSQPTSSCHQFFQELTKTAAIELGRNPQNLSEILDHGLFLDINTILQRLYLDPTDERAHGYTEDRIRKEGSNIMRLGEEGITFWQNIIETKKKPVYTVPLKKADNLMQNTPGGVEAVNVTPPKDDGLVIQEPAIDKITPIVPELPVVKLSKPLKTQIVPKDPAVESFQPLFSRIPKEQNFYDSNPCYTLNTPTGEKLGWIAICKRPEDILAPQGIKDNSYDNYDNVGRALVEIAVRKSFTLGLGGKVVLATENLSRAKDYFKLGFRFPYPLYGYTGEGSLKVMIPGVYKAQSKACQEYLKRKQRGESTQEIVEKIEGFYAENTDFIQDAKVIAAIVLKREPKDLQEIFEHGLQINRNVMLEIYFSDEPKHENFKGFLKDCCDLHGDHMVLSEQEIAKWKEIIEN